MDSVRANICQSAGSGCAEGIQSGLARLSQARTFLFVPGNRPDRFDKAIASGADSVVLDLEDSVPAMEKAAARLAISAALRSLHRRAGVTVIRINSPQTEEGAEDIAWLRILLDIEPVLAVMVPKVESEDEIRRVIHSAPCAVALPLIESAQGWARMQQIAAVPGVARLVLGNIDFQADTGICCSDDERELDALRFAMAMQSRLQRLAPPVDGVTTLIDDTERIRLDTARAIRFGFGAKLCIHPRQISTVHDAFAPSDAELLWARRVIAADAAAGGAAVKVDGGMVDMPLVLRAKRIIARADWNRGCA